jgi:integrase
LLYFAGLRCCDISNLRFSDIDFDKDEISISQQKTNVPLKLPLSAVVGNAVYDYVNGDRRESDTFYIFLSEYPPYDKLKAGSIGVIANQIYNAAEIRMSSDDRRGGHLFRHNFATAMLENDVPRTIISKAMGQTNPHSADTYLSSDMVHLKECALSIEEFPVGKGVFSVE